MVSMEVLIVGLHRKLKYTNFFMIISFPFSVRCTKDASEWVLVPSFFVPKPLYMYSKLFEKMEVMLSNIYTTADSKKGLGVVVGVGKIAVQQELINCSAVNYYYLNNELCFILNFF